MPTDGNTWSGPRQSAVKMKWRLSDESSLWDPQIVVLDDRTRNYGEKGCDDKRKS